MTRIRKDLLDSAGLAFVPPPDGRPCLFCGGPWTSGYFRAEPLEFHSEFDRFMAPVYYRCQCSDCGVSWRCKYEHVQVRGVQRLTLVAVEEGLPRAYS